MLLKGLAAALRVAPAPLPTQPDPERLPLAPLHLNVQSRPAETLKDTPPSQSAPPPPPQSGAAHAAAVSSLGEEGAAAAASSSAQREASLTPGASTLTRRMMNAATSFSSCAKSSGTATPLAQEARSSPGQPPSRVFAEVETSAACASARSETRSSAAAGGGDLEGLRHSLESYTFWESVFRGSSPAPPLPPHTARVDAAPGVDLRVRADAAQQTSASGVVLTQPAAGTADAVPTGAISHPVSVAGGAVALQPSIGAAVALSQAAQATCLAMGPFAPLHPATQYYGQLCYVLPAGPHREPRRRRRRAFGAPLGVQSLQRCLGRQRRLSRGCRRA